MPVTKSDAFVITKVVTLHGAISYIPHTISIIATIAMIGTYWSFEEKSKSNAKLVTGLYSNFTGPTTLKQWLNSRKWWWQRGQWGRNERELEFQVGRETLPLGPGLSNEPQHQHQPPDDHQHDDQHQHQAELMSMSMCHLQILPTRICLKLLVWNRLAQLLVSIYLLYWHWSGVFRLWANERHRILIATADLEQELSAGIWLKSAIINS